LKYFASLTGVNPHMKVLGAAFLTLIKMGSSPLPRPHKRCEVRELAERARAFPAAPAPSRDQMRENCAREGRCLHTVTR
jgi:hypothetical protein